MGKPVKQGKEKRVAAKTLNYEDIMERLLRLDRKACICLRPTFKPGHRRWYVSFGSVVLGSVNGNGWSGFFGNGDTPKNAVINTWIEILRMSKELNIFFLRYRCRPDENIPGSGPQVWVRWSEQKDDWEDVVPTEDNLIKNKIPADRICPYSEHKWKECLIR